MILIVGILILGSCEELIAAVFAHLDADGDGRLVNLIV